MEKLIRKILMISLILIMGSLLLACNMDKNNEKDKSVADVYFINTRTSGLASEQYTLISSKPEEQVNELLYMLKLPPQNLVYKSVLPSKITYTYSLNKDGSLTIDFDSSYSELSGVGEILSRAAIVKTLCQISEVEYIQINVNGNPLIDANTDVVGPLTDEDFIDNTESNTNYHVKLYFANKEGNALIEFLTDINYSGTESLEELAIKQLINGPTELGMYDTIPKGTILLNLYKSDGTCYVDFNNKFLEKRPDITDKVAIYSVVNTLVELPDINKVQFRINGDTVKTYFENTNFDEPFERNLDLIEKN